MILLLRCEMDEEEEQKMLQHLHFLADSTVRFSHPGMLLGSLSVAIYIKECILRVFNVILFMQTFAKYRNKYKKNKSFHSFIFTLWRSLFLSFLLSLSPPPFYRHFSKPWLPPGMCRLEYSSEGGTLLLSYCFLTAHTRRLWLIF